MSRCPSSWLSVRTWDESSTSTRYDTVLAAKSVKPLAPKIDAASGTSTTVKPLPSISATKPSRSPGGAWPFRYPLTTYGQIRSLARSEAKT